jgi:asparagine synthase (glutamine-hydrolysing)
MAVGLEARVPLLDYDFIELANSIPQKMKFKRFCLKYVLKKIASNYVPKEVVYRKKIGFDIPLDCWLRNDLADNLREYVLKKDIPFLNYGHIEILLTEFFAGRHNEYADFFWSYLMLEQWYELWCKGKIPSPLKI